MYDHFCCIYKRELTQLLCLYTGQGANYNTLRQFIRTNNCVFLDTVSLFFFFQTVAVQVLTRNRISGPVVPDPIHHLLVDQFKVQSLDLIRFIHLYLIKQTIIVIHNTNQVKKTNEFLCIYVANFIFIRIFSTICAI